MGLYKKQQSLLVSFLMKIPRNHKIISKKSIKNNWQQGEKNDNFWLLEVSTLYCFFSHGSSSHDRD